MAILVTGGTGFIGSHTCVELLNAGEEVVIIDNLSNSKISVVDKIKKITGKNLKFYEADVCSEEKLEQIFIENKIEAAIHFAGFKAVGESVKIPLDYYYNNIMSTLVLCKVMKKYNCKKIVFSSSATVYGAPKSVPIREDFPLSTTNPYGATKLMIEDILRDLYISDNEWSIALLRYFNPIGAHESRLIGENPNGIPNNLMPRVIYTVIGKMDYLTVCGDDFETKDGTGVRDYIHVVDLAKGHVKAIEFVKKTTGAEAINLGTGNGYSVYDIINTFSRVNNVEVKNKVVERRAGDIAECYADPEKAKRLLNWEAKLNLETMCRDAWEYAKNNF